MVIEMAIFIFRWKNTFPHTIKKTGVKKTGKTRCTMVHKDHFSCQGTKASWLTDTLWQILLSKRKKILLSLLSVCPPVRTGLSWSCLGNWHGLPPTSTAGISKPEATTVNTEKHTCRDKNYTYKERCGVVAMPVVEESKKAARKYQWVLFLFGSLAF